MPLPFRITSATLFSKEVCTRLPFRYGIATMTHLPHVFLQVVLEGPRGESRGISADHLPPKWFTKDPDANIADEIATMRSVIVHAASTAKGISFANVFNLWRELWNAQDAWARAHSHPSLLAHFGTSLVERAVIDAFCRLQGITFADAVHGDHLGIDFHSLDRTLPVDWKRLLPSTPLTSVVARHTVGLADDIFDADVVASGTAVNDGLPVSLESAIRTYQLREFKIKFTGDWERDSTRLARIFECLESQAVSNWRYSLDGNESFADAADFRAYWSRLVEAGWMRPHLHRLLFVEQPVSRRTALTAGADWRSWPGAPRITIDESDGGLDDVPTSLKLGYAGSTHKNCKGVFKGLLNRCRLIAAAGDGPPMLMSGEDLSNIGPVALLQDLTVQALLGNRSVERNGHHYFRGLSMWPEAFQHRVTTAHPDLYDDRRGFASLEIREGSLQLASALAAPFGYGLELNPEELGMIGQEIV